MPSLSLTVTTTVLIGFLIVPLREIPVLLQTAVGGMFIVSNFIIAQNSIDYFAPDANWNPLLHIWSLSVEEQFYLFFPVLLAVFSLIKIRGKNKFQIPIWIIFFASVFILFFSRDTNRIFFNYYSPFLRGWEFAAGAILLFLPQINRNLWRNSLIILSITFFSISLIIKHLNPIDYNTGLIVLSTAIFIKIGEGAQSQKSLLNLKFLQWLGDRSYSWYLWHLPFLSFVKFLWPNQSSKTLFATLLSLLVSTITYSLLENPLRKFNIGNMKLWVILVVTTLAIPLSVVGVLSKYYYPKLQSKVFLIEPQLHIHNIRGCENFISPNVRNLAKCEFYSEFFNSSSPIYLIGDSNAGQFSEPILQIGKKYRRTVIIITQPMAYFVNGGEFRNLVDNSWAIKTQSFKSGIIRYLEAAKPGLVVLAFSDQVLTNDSWQVLSNGIWTSKSSSKIQSFTNSMVSAILEIEKMGHRIALVQTIPFIPGEYWEKIQSRLAVKELIRNPVFPRNSIPKVHEEVRDAVRMVEKRTSIRVLDFMNKICDNNSCDLLYRRSPIYQNVTHISVSFANTLTSDFEVQLFNTVHKHSKS